MKKTEDNRAQQIKAEKNNNDSNEFNFILKRSENVVKIKNINNKVKKLDYTFSSEENYSDEVLDYLTQTIDKKNQYKYNNFLNNSNNNFIIYNANYLNDIDAYYQYELIKREIHNNQKAFNVHEHRKIPYEEQNRQLYRRTFNNNNNNYYKNQTNRYNYKNRRNASVNSYYRVNEEEDRNRDRVRVGGIPEFTNNNNHNHNFHISNEEYEDNRNRSMDNINYRENFGNKKRRNFGNHGLTSYMPFREEKIKNFKEDEEEFS
jgi:hypothetical protein